MFLDLTYVTEVHMGHTRALLVFNAWRTQRWQVRMFRGLTSVPFTQEGPFRTGPFQETSITISSLNEKQCPG